MDQRDFAFWSREALRARVTAMLSMRMAIHADQDGFSRMVKELNDEISATEGTKGMEVESNWAALQEIGRR